MDNQKRMKGKARSDIVELQHTSKPKGALTVRWSLATSEIRSVSTIPIPSSRWTILVDSKLPTKIAATLAHWVASLALAAWEPSRLQCSPCLLAYIHPVIDMAIPDSLQPYPHACVDTYVAYASCFLHTNKRRNTQPLW